MPRKTIYRLSIYLRCLARLRENSIGTVSSEALAKAAGVKSTQLRKDLAYFGTFGTRGPDHPVDPGDSTPPANPRYQRTDPRTQRDPDPGQPDCRTRPLSLR